MTRAGRAGHVRVVISGASFDLSCLWALGFICDTVEQIGSFARIQFGFALDRSGAVKRPRFDAASMRV